MNRLRPESRGEQNACDAKPRDSFVLTEERFE
jgi:hypothetical protein